MARISSTSAGGAGVRDSVSATNSNRDCASNRGSDSTSNRELGIIEKFLHPLHLLVLKVQNSASTSHKGCQAHILPNPLP